jgi:hypothetical protein
MTISLEGQEPQAPQQLFSSPWVERPSGREASVRGGDLEI